MGFFHRMREGDVIIPVAFLNQNRMFVGCILRFEGRQGNSAAAECAHADGLDDVAADGADIETHFADVGGTVAVHRKLPCEQFGNGNAKRSGKLHEDADIRKSPAGFPFGNGFVAHAESFRKLFLGKILLLTQIADGRACDVIHGMTAFLLC